MAKNMLPKAATDDYYDGGQSERANSSDVAPIQDQHIRALPTWKPDAHPDAALVQIAPAELDGSFTAAHNSSHPEVLAHLQGGAFLSSDELHTGGPFEHKERAAAVADQSKPRPGE